MGQKINPQLFRLGQTSTWQSKWFDTKNYAKYLLEDFRLRQAVLLKLRKAVAEIEIERTGQNTTINLLTSRPGMIIGRGGAGVEDLRKILKPISSTTNLTINIQEIKNPDSSAAVIANNIVEQIERRIPFRRALKQAIEAGKQARVEGMRISIAGRLNGAEIARRETLSFGKVPLHTIKSPINYASRTAYTTYGTIGVKVWVLDTANAEDIHA